MASSKNGIITRKDIIEDAALEFGKLYADQLKVAIEQNKVFVKGIKDIRDGMNAILKASNNSEYISAKNKEALATQKASNELKLQTQLELGLQTVKKSTIATEKLSLDLKAKQSKVSKEHTNLLIEEQKLILQKTKAQAEEIRLNQELQKLTNQEMQTDNIKIKNLQQEEALIQKRLQTVRNENQLIEQQQKITKNNLDIKAKEIAAADKEEKKRLSSIKLSAQERFDAQQKNKNDKDQIIITSRLTSELQKLDAKVRLAKRAYLDIFIAGQQVGESTKTYTRRLNEARDAYDKLKDKSIAANRAVRQFNDNVGNYPKQAITGLRNLVGAFGLIGGVAAFASVVKKSIEIIKEFDQSVADLSAITGASGADLDFLKEKAIELGRGTKGGAVAVIEAYKLIASAKPELLTNVDALNKVTEATILLSQASGLEIPDAATRFTDAMNQFGADASQAGIFVDALANGAKFGAAEIPEITEALLKFGAVARSSNISIQESTALIELLAENGLKGADAGTALRNVLLKISAPDALGKRARAEFDKLGISLDTLKDKSVPLQKKLEILQPLLKDNASIVKVFGLENATAAINVLSHTDRLKELTGQMGKVGTASEQAAIRTDTLQGSFDRLDAAYSSFILSVSQKGNGLGNLLKGISNLLKDELEGLTELFESQEKTRQRTLDDLRKKGNDETIAYYNGLKDFNQQDLENTRQYNIDKEKELVKEFEHLQRRNVILKALQRDTPLGTIETAQNKKERIANEKQLVEINNLISYLKGQVSGATTVLASKNPAKSTNLPDPINTNTVAEESKKQRDARLKALKEQYEDQKKADEALFKLQQLRIQREIDINDFIIEDEKATLKEKLEANTENAKLLTELKRNQAKYDLQQLGKYNEESGQFVRQLSDSEIKEILNTGKTKRELRADELVIYETFKNSQFEIDKKFNDKSVKLIEDDFKEQIDRQVLNLDTLTQNALQAENELYQQRIKNAGNNNKLLEEAAEEHQRRVEEIQREGARKALKVQIDLLEQILAIEKLSEKEREKIANDLAKAKKAYSDADVENAKSSTKKVAFLESEQFKNIFSSSQELTANLQGLANQLYQNKIDQYDREIEASNRYYDNEILKAGDDVRKKDLIQKEQKAKADQLEKKKRQEQHKQAVLNKVLAIAQTSILGAQAAIKGFADSGYAGLILAVAASAAAIATIVATPIPNAYKKGRKGGIAEDAIVGEGKSGGKWVPEVVTDKRGQNPVLYTEPSLIRLKEGDMVHKSTDDYMDYMRKATLAGVNIESERVFKYQNDTQGDKYSKDILDELKRNTAAVKKSKPIINQQKMPDLNYQFWRSMQVKWRN